MKRLWKVILAVFTKRSARKDMKMLRMQVYLLNVVKSHAFAKLTLQDKLSSLARLIDIFQHDFGFTPKELGKLIKTLNQRLDEEMAIVWDETYAQYFSKKASKQPR
jgi:hypothetical protein